MSKSHIITCFLYRQNFISYVDMIYVGTDDSKLWKWFYVYNDLSVMSHLAFRFSCIYEDRNEAQHYTLVKYCTSLTSYALKIADKNKTIWAPGIDRQWLVIQHYTNNISERSRPQMCSRNSSFNWKSNLLIPYIHSISQWNRFI